MTPEAGSPDALAVVRLVDRALRRSQMVAAAESAAIGAAIAAWSIPAGVLAAALSAVWQSRLTTKRSVVRTLERADPQARNLLVTAYELSTGELSTSPQIHGRVTEEAAVIVRSVSLAALFPAARALALALLAVAVWSGSFAAGLRPGREAIEPLTGSRTPSGAAVPQDPGLLHVTVTIKPPSYTHLPSTTSRDPAQLSAVEHSVMRLIVESGAAGVTLDLSGDVRALTPAAAGRFVHEATLTASGYALVTTGAGARRLIPITVEADALPAVRMPVPGRDLVYDGGDRRIQFEAQAEDDYGLGSLALRYTKVSGSGEQFEFADGEIPLAVTRASDREWRGAAARTLSELGLHEGDMLVYRAVATDRRPGGGESSSDAFFIEISKLGAAAGDAFTLPEQETRYALSQQMLIVKTERLNHERASMNAEAFTQASQNLAVEQRMIRSEFVFMLGGEVEDEELEAERSVEVLAGRLANRGQRDIRDATIAMSQAEKLLTGTNTGDALKAERAAVEALQRAFSRERYILRALATRSPLDASRRLTGAAGRSLEWRRQLAEPPANRRAALLGSVLEGLGRVDGARQLSVLSEMTVRIDPASAPLRRIAADLQHLADAWAAADGASRRRALDAVAAAVSAEAVRALADPPAALGAAR